MELPQYPPPYPPIRVAPEYVQGPPPMVVTTQPTVVATMPQPVYNDYLAWSIVNIIFCCPPFGIVALIYSMQARDAIDRLDSQGASRSSRSAFTWNVVALSLGLCINIGWISYVIYYAVSGRYTYYYYG